jgi:perosamine synthetase
MSNLNASLGSAQIERIEDIIKVKRNIAKMYSENFENNKFVKFVKEPDYGFSNYAYPNIILKKGNKKLRNNLIKYLGKNKINSRAMFPQASNMPMFEKRFNNLNSKFVSDNGITLPSWPGIKKNDIKKVCFQITKVLSDNNL